MRIPYYLCKRSVHSNSAVRGHTCFLGELPAAGAAGHGAAGCRPQRLAARPTRRCAWGVTQAPSLQVCMPLSIDAGLQWLNKQRRLGAGDMPQMLVHMSSFKSG